MSSKVAPRGRPLGTMSKLKGFRQRFQFAVAMGVILLALIALAIPLRLESMREVSDVRLERTQRQLREATHRFTDDFNREITRALLYFALERSADQSQIERRILDRYANWMEQSPHPHLIASVYLERETGGGEHDLLRLDTAGGQFQPFDWPSHFQSLLIELENQGDRWVRHRGPSRVVSTFQGDIPALVLPALYGDAERSSIDEAHVIVELDTDFISGELLPALTERHLAIHDGPPYQIAVIRPGEPAKVIYQSDKDFSVQDFATPDVQENLFDSLHHAHLEGLWSDVRLSLGTLMSGSDPNRSGRGRSMRSSGSNALSSVLSEAGREEGQWQVLVRHPAGSLQKAFERHRRRNTLLSMGILGLLGTTAVLLVVSTQRAQKFAKQQVEFVSSVSHELRTPLSVIRMAARNLERGTIRDHEGIKRYANLIGMEERRLTEMVERVLAFGQTQSNEKPYSMQTVSLRGVVDAALADCRPLIEEREARIECDLLSDELFVVGDPEALRRAVQNLVANAVKHGGQKPLVLIRVTEASKAKSPEVVVTVEDQGGGIAKKDLPHIFEPFYRGSRAVEDQIQGSGLGLTLVKEIIEAHGGSVAVKSDRIGSRFTLRIPAAPRGGASNESEDETT